MGINQKLEFFTVPSRCAGSQGVPRSQNHCFWAIFGIYQLLAMGNIPEQLRYV